MQLDAAVRGAADTVSFGLADEIAGFGDTLVGAGGPGDFGDRLAVNIEAQRARDAYDAEHRRLARSAGQLGGLALGIAGGARAGTVGSNALPSNLKGKLGEGLSWGKGVLIGDFPIKGQVRRNLSKSFTVADWKRMSGKLVEAKFGYSAGLTKAQRRALRELGPLGEYIVERWYPHHIGRGTGAAAGAGMGIADVSE